MLASYSFRHRYAYAADEAGFNDRMTSKLMGHSRETFVKFYGDKARDEELLGEKEIEKQFLKKIRAVEKGFKAQWDRGNDQLDYWDCFDCLLGGKQTYAGNSQIFLPIIALIVVLILDPKQPPASTAAPAPPPVTPDA